MKEVFKGFYNIEKTVLQELWNDEKTLFVFDANVFLNLYGYAKQTRDDFFNILQVINEKLWIPYHVGLEYQRRRLDVIRNEKIIFKEIESNLNKIKNVFKGDFEKLALKRRFPKLFESTEKLEKDISKSISNYKRSVQHWDSEQPCVRSHDEIRENIDKLFSGKVGDKPESQEWLDKLYQEGVERFKKNIPPGFKDGGKGNDKESHFHFDGLYYERKFGDLVLWKQLINKSTCKDVENVIFITDDSKEDWWYQINSNGKKTIGPLPELQSEIYRESNIKNFHMYSTSMFLEDGKLSLSIDVSESSIEDASATHIIGSLNNLDYDRLREISESSKLYDSERWREIFERYKKVTSIDDERLREISRSLNLNDSKRWREIFERYNKVSSIDDERLREISRSLNLNDSERWREIFDGYNKQSSINDSKKVGEFYERLNMLLRDKDEDDESED